MRILNLQFQLKISLASLYAFFFVLPFSYLILPVVCGTQLFIISFIFILIVALCPLTKENGSQMEFINVAISVIQVLGELDV
jgi:hypothetical protein